MVGWEAFVCVKVRGPEAEALACGAGKKVFFRLATCCELARERVRDKEGETGRITFGVERLKTQRSCFRSEEETPEPRAFWEIYAEIRLRAQKGT